MNDPTVAAGQQPSEARELTDHLSSLRARVRRDRRATSFPLLLLGGATVLGVAPNLLRAQPAPPWWDWLTSLLITIAFAVMWYVFRRRARRGGVGHSTGFGAAAIVALFLSLPLGVLATTFAGPYLVFGLGLLIAGIWQHNRFLIGWSVLIGGIGVFEGFFGITNRLPVSLWHEWVHPAIYLVLAGATVLAGLIALARENRGS
jgi:hypothetical protein